MKRCPECRRDYYDDSLSFCLDDGSELLEGPSSMDEPATELLGSSGSDAETKRYRSSTGEGIRRTKQNAVTQISSVWPAAALVVIVLGAIGFIGYRYYTGSGSGSGQVSSIAVLPFENKSGSSDTDYLSDGLTDSLIYRLSQLPGLRVSPTSSVMTYKGKTADIAQIAKELDVEAVLSGRLMQIGESLNVSVQLIDARSKKLIWAEQYDRKMSDLLATQREIATTITQKLQLRLSGDEKGIAKKYTNSNEAYQLYLKGRFHWARRTKDDMFKSIDAFKQAIDLDPNFALAYVGIAEAYNSMGKNPDASPAETIPKAKAAAIRAIEIDPLLAEAHSALGDSLSLYDWDWPRSEAEFKHAIELDPNIGYIHLAYSGTYLTAAGRMDESVREAELAVELEPLSLINNSVLACMYLLNRQYDKAREQGRKTYELDPNFPLTKLWLGLSYSLDGKYDDALGLFRDVPADSRERAMALVVTAFAQAKASRKSDAENALKQIDEIAKTQYVRPYYLAWVYSALGDKDKAIAKLQQSFDERDCYLPRARVDPLLDQLRDDQRFKELMSKLNLP